MDALFHAIEPRLDDVEHLVDLIGGDDERRTEGDRIAHRADDEAKLLKRIGAGRADTLFGPEGAPRVFVRHQFQGTDEAHRTRIADQRMTAEPADTAYEDWRHLADMVNDADALIDFDGLERHRAADGMGGIGEPVPESAELPALIEHRLVEFFLDGDSAHREISGGNRVGH